MTAWRAYNVTVLGQVRTGLDKSEQGWSTIFPQPWVARFPNLAHPQNLRAVFYLYLARNSTILQSGGNSLSSRFNWRKVWNGVKCNFSWAHLHRRYGDGKLSISGPAWTWNFTRIGRKTKKLRLSIIPAQRRSHQPPLGQPIKVRTATFLGRTWTSHTLFESSRSRKLKYAVSAGLVKR